MVKEVRGKGLLLGIEFTAPRRLALRAPFEAFAQIHPAMFGQILVMRLFRNKNILTQICGNDFMVLKVAPPLWLPRRRSRNSSRQSATSSILRTIPVPSGLRLWGWRGERSAA